MGEGAPAPPLSWQLCGTSTGTARIGTWPGEEHLHLHTSVHPGCGGGSTPASPPPAGSTSLFLSLSGLLSTGAGSLVGTITWCRWGLLGGGGDLPPAPWPLLSLGSLLGGVPSLLPPHLPTPGAEDGAPAGGPPPPPPQVHTSPTNLHQGGAGGAHPPLPTHPHPGRRALLPLLPITRSGFSSFLLIPLFPLSPSLPTPHPLSPAG